MVEGMKLALDSREPMNTQALMLRPGQLLKGKVLSINEESVAEIQIGAQRLFAKTSNRSLTNKEIWFIVQKNSDGLHLQIIDENQFMKNRSPQDILRSMGLDRTQERVELIKWFQNREEPINQALLKSFAHWLTGNTKEDLAIFKTLLDNSLPLTKEVFNAVHSVKSQPSIEKVIDNLQNELKPYLFQQTAKALDLQLTKLNNQFSDKILTNLLFTWLKNGPYAEESFTQLQKLSVFSPEIGEEQVIQQLLYTSYNDKNKMVLALMQAFERSGQQKQTAPFLLALTKLNHAFSFTWEKGADMHAGIKSGEITLPIHTEQMRSLIKDGLAKLYGTSSTSILQTALPTKEVYSRLYEQLQSIQTVSNSDLSAAQKRLYEIAEENRQQWHTPAVIKGELKQLLALVGLSYEQQISERQQVDIQAIKPLILQLLKEIKQPGVTEAGKELLNKITGMQLLSLDTNGLSHFVMQLPFPLSAFSKVLSMQWSSKSKKNGEIDPSFCRVLFHLNMETLGETFISLQIQNRVLSMNISIENKRQLPDTTLLEEQIKSKLSEINFQLTQITFSHINCREEDEKKKKKTNTMQMTGVDIRI